MSAPLRLSAAHARSVARSEVSPDRADVSSRKFSASQVRRDVFTYRAHFALVWQRFITETYRNPSEVKAAFGVDITTAENWFRGDNAPYGWVVGRAIADPDTRDAVLKVLTEDKS